MPLSPARLMHDIRANTRWALAKQGYTKHYFNLPRPKP
jgi:hypothetical protein